MSENLFKSIPKEYPFYVRATESHFTNYLVRFWPEKVTAEVHHNSNGTEYKNTNNTALLRTGPMEVEGIKFYVINHSMSGCYGFCFTSREAYYEFKQLLIDTYQKHFPKAIETGTPIYNYGIHGWQKTGSINSYTSDCLVGYQDYLSDIEQTIKIHIDNMELLTSIGEARSLNFTLHGPPGVGKTTLIKTVASTMHIPVCMVKPDHVNTDAITQILNPVINGNPSKTVIVVFEDFDRFLTRNQAATESCMSQLLNALDGFEDNANVIRFFSANQSQVLFDKPALVNRMSNVYEFTYPKREAFNEKLMYLIDKLGADKNDATKFLDLIETIDNLTLRPFTTYCVRYILEPTYYKTKKVDYMTLLIDNIDKLRSLCSKC